jgi:hypothetical protein
MILMHSLEAWAKGSAVTPHFPRLLILSCIAESWSFSV